MGFERSDRVLSKSQTVLSAGRHVTAKKLLGEQPNITGPLTQGRQVERDDRQAIE